MKEKLPEPLHTAIKTVFDQVAMLRKQYPGKRFTPGDKLIGDMGEVLAETLFGMVPLHKKSHDCFFHNIKKCVQVKITSGKRLGLGNEKIEFEHLLAFQIYPDGFFEELYNGNGNRIADAIKDN